MNCLVGVPCEYALHGVVGRVSGGGDPGLEAGAAEVVVVADQALEPPTAEVTLHTRITGHSLMPGHYRSLKNNIIYSYISFSVLIFNHY